MAITVSTSTSSVSANNTDLDYSSDFIQDVTVRKKFGLTNDRLANYNSFNIFKLYSSVDPLTSGIAYVFMTRPACNLIDQNIERDSVFDYLVGKTSMWQIIKAALGNTEVSTDNSINLIHGITNLITSFDTKDLVLTTSSVGDNMYGQVIKVGNNLRESESADTLALNFIETDDLYITLLHLAWVRYIAMIRYGTFAPTINSIVKKEIDYASSLYYIMTKVDGHTITYWSKYTGVFPTSVPLSSLSWRLGDNSIKNISINYEYSFKEDLNPLILLSDFNRVVGASPASTMNAVHTYQSALEGMDQSSYAAYYESSGSYSNAYTTTTKYGIGSKTLSENWCSNVWVSAEKTTEGDIYYKLNFSGSSA